jgi:hypothetical protein
MPSILLGSWEKNGSHGSIKLDCSGGGSQPLLATTVVLDAEHGGNKALAILHLENAVAIPAMLVDEASGQFYPLEKIKDDLLQQERRELADKLKDVSFRVDMGAQGQAQFFGAGAVLNAGADAKLTVVGALRPTALLEKVADPEAILFEVQAKASISTAISIDADGGTDEKTESRTLTIDVKIRRDDLPTLAFEFDVPTLDLKWPKIEFPLLSLHGLELRGFERLLHLPMWRIADMDIPLKLHWNPPPVFTLTIDAATRRLAIETSTNGEGELQFQLHPNDPPTQLFVIERFAVSGATGNFRFEVKIKKTGAIHTKIAFEHEIGPFAVKVDDVLFEYDIAYANGKVTAAVKCTIGRAQVSCVSDPNLGIAAKLVFTVRAVLGEDSLKTEVTSLELIEPYPMKLIAEAGKAIGNVLRLLGAIRIPPPSAPELPAFKVLEHLARMLAEAVKWLARKAGEALIGVAEAIGAILKSMLDVLRKLPKPGLTDFVTFEICLDPATLRLVQLSIMPAYEDGTADVEPLSFSALGVDIATPRFCRPTLVLRFDDNDLTCVAMVVWLGGADHAVSIGTDLWLTNNDGAQQALTDQSVDPENPATKKLLQLNASLPGGKRQGIALAVLSRGKRRADFLQLVQQDASDPIDISADGNKSKVILLTPAARFTPFDVGSLKLDFSVEPNRILNLLGKSADGSEPEDSTGLFKQLSQYIKVTGGSAEVKGREAVVPLDVELKVAGSTVQTKLELRAHIPTLRMRLTGAQAIQIRDVAKVHELMGFQLRIDPHEGTQLDKNNQFPHFVLSFADGNAALSLAPEADAEVSYKKVSRQGRGLVFAIDDFSISRDGLDLSAQVKKDPVVLSGVDTPFRFTSGSLTIKRGKIIGASIAGTGQLPNKLVGEATAEVAITLGRGKNNDLIVESALGIFKPGTPLVCEGTRFRFQIDELGFTFAQDDGGYHFYFLLTGEARFRPGDGEFRSGLLSNLSKTRIVLKRVPLAGDSRALMRCIEFQMPIDPPAKVSLFNIFKFQLKGIGFHPASPKFGGAAAMSISGQIAFVPSGDIPNVKIDLHQLWIAPPKDGDSMPRFRCDGLGVEVRASSSVKISATAITVDDQTPSLYTGLEPGGGVTARGFLANGRIEITGWAPVRASMGFLELRKRIDEHTEGPARHAFFVYGQADRLAIPINIFGYDLFMQEVGFGFGYRYTLAGIAEADKVTTPQALVRVLDEVSKYQGNLHEFKAWRPEVDGDRITLAMRVMIALTGASQGGEWNEDGEKNLPANLLLFDIVAALRSDLTFLMTGRAWLCRTYGDWTFSEDSEPWKERPMMRGYLYLSVPRQMLLARVLADGTGEVGDHPKLFGPLKTALEVTRWSSTLYVAPGIFHQEFGWPYELGFTLENDKKTFRLVVEGGMIMRIAEGAVLNGVAFRAKGLAVVGGRAGSSRLGASAEARAEFAIEAKLIAYVSTRRIGDTFFYGLLSLDVAVSFRVRVWLQIKIFKKKIRLEIGFSFGLSLSIALEAVIGAESPYVGARARVAIGVRGFGRSLTIGVGVKFNDGYLSDARDRVARFMTLGLGASTPDPEQGLNSAPAPLPEPSRGERAANSDKRLQSRAEAKDDLGGYDINDEQPIDEQDTTDDVSLPMDEEEPKPGRQIGVTNYWALLHPTRRRDVANNSEEGESYILQLIPRDESSISEGGVPSTFYASPRYRDSPEIGTTGSRDYDHKLKAAGTGAFSELMQIQVGAAASPMMWSAGEINTEVDWDAEIPQEEKTANLRVQHLMGDCFLSWDPKDPGRPFTEPLQRSFQGGASLARLPQDAQESAEKLHAAAHSREVLGDARGDSAVVEERRSSVIGIIAESAARVAAVGPDPTGLWPARDTSNGLDCRDLGLTFWITRAELNSLFDATNRWKAHFDVLTAVSKFVGEPKDGYGNTELEAGQVGTVHILNPPDQFFASSQPTLARQRKQLIPGGLALNWDLEPAWGESASVIEDPEYVLKHYRIERRILNAQRVQTLRTVTIKPAAPVEFSKDDSKGGYGLEFLRPNYQFIDDFSDLPPALRAAMLRLPGDVQDQNGDKIVEDVEKAWSNAFGIEPSARVIYSIVPVDIAGTEADATIIEHEIPRPIQKPDPLRQVQLQVGYSTLPEARKEPDPKADLLLTVLDDRKEMKEPIRKAVSQSAPPESLGAVFIIRVRRSEILEGGSFGDDHVPQSDRINSDADAELLQSGDLDFVVEMLAKPKPDERISVRYRPVSAKDELFKRVDLPARIYPAPTNIEDAASGESQPIAVAENPMSFRQALGLDGKQNNVVSVRLFARPLLKNSDPQQRKGLWRMVDMTVQVMQPAGNHPKFRDPMIDVQVERFEHPVKADFRALHRSDMKASAGRLHSVYPAADAFLGGLLAQGTEDAAIKVFRDPQRRSGIRLTWSAHPTVLTYSGTQLEPQRGVIGGFDLFSWNPDALPRATDSAQSLEFDVPRHSQYLGRIGVLPESLRGLVPSEVGELSRVEASYQSETWRMVEARNALRTSGSKARRARWFSPAESTLAWPLKLLRKQLLPLPDEMDVTRCFSRGVPKKIEATFSKSPKGFESWTIEPNILERQEPAKISVDEVRCWLRSLQWTARDDVKSSFHAAFASDPTTFRDVELMLTVTFQGGRPPLTPLTIAIPIDFEGRHHAVIEEMLCELRYEKLHDTTYRRYEPVVEKVAKSSAPREWISFLQETVEGPDPYGWGVLREFGLAAGIRLYNTETGEFLSGKDVATRVNAALSTVLRRYDNEYRRGDLGSPLVELITHPDARFEVSSYDGADPPPNPRRVKNELLAFVQVSLRPAPQRLISADIDTSLGAAMSPVHYLKLEFLRRPGLDDSLSIPAQLLSGTGLDDAGNPVVVNPINAMSLELDFSLGHFAGRPGACLASGLKEAKLPEPEGLEQKILVCQPLVPGDPASVGPLPNPDENSSSPLPSFALARLTMVGDCQSITIEALTKFLQEKVLPSSLRATWLRHSREPVLNRIDGAPHDKSIEVFERFPELAPEILATLIGGRRSVPVPAHANWRRHYEVLASWARGCEDVIPTVGSVLDTPEKVEARWLDIATHLAPWSRRFMDHSVSQRPERTEVGVKIPFAIATIPNPDPWRVPVARDGTLDVLLIEKDRFGKRIRYALRPFGRYTAFEEAERRMIQTAEDQLTTANNVVAVVPPPKPFSLIPTLDGALDKPANLQAFEPFIEVHLPRTEPVATPVILSARRKDMKDRRLELVVARPQDETLADANTAVEAAVSSSGIGLEFKREYAAGEWTDRIKKVASWQFDPLDAVEPKRPMEPLPRLPWASSEVVELRRRVPDLWRGAMVYSFADIPYFYRIHVLVHAAAGVVVSDHAVATFADGPSKLGWPENVGPPQWSIQCAGVDDESRAVVVTFPLVRFRDCMYPEQVANWIRGKDVPKAWFVPEPSVNYTIQLTALADGAPAATSAEIELRPVDPEKKNNATTEPSFYFGEAVGRRFQKPAVDLIPRVTADANLLSIAVPLASVGETLTPPPDMWPSTWTSSPANFDKLLLTPTQIGSLCMHLPTRDGKVCVDKFTQDNLTRIPAAAAIYAARIEEMLAAVPDDPLYEDWRANFAPAIQRVLVLFQELAKQGADQPEERWKTFVESNLGGSVVGDSYELPAVLPAGMLLNLQSAGELRHVWVAATWTPPQQPPHEYRHRSIVDLELATNVSADERRSIRRNLRYRQIAVRRALFENPALGFAPLKEAAPPETSPPDPSVWAGINERTFDALYSVEVEVPIATDTAAREKLLRAFDEIPSATDAIQQLGVFEDGVSAEEPAAGTKLRLPVPVRYIQKLDDIGSTKPSFVSSYFLRRPATRDELDVLASQDPGLRDVILEMIPKQVFGPGLRPELRVSRALETLRPEPIVQSS